MKLFQILESEFDDEHIDDLSSRMRKLTSTQYIWHKLYDGFDKAIRNGNKKVEQEYRQKLIKHQHLWALQPNHAYWYAVNIIEKRFPEGEAVILKNPMWAYKYARYVIQGRWPEAESVIAKDPAHKQAYEQYFKCKI